MVSKRASDSVRSTHQKDKRAWSWHERAVQWLDFPLGRFLDYGCGTCVLLCRIRGNCTECHGVDVDAAKIAEATEQHPDLSLKAIGLDGRTEYPDDHFDAIAMLEVIEHVPDERATLTEVARILAPGGKLLLTTPHRGLLTFLDVGNFKFVAPRIHRFIHHTLLRNRRYYARRFEAADSSGLVGDISISKDRDTWHRHYKAEEIIAFCSDKLVPVKHEVYFPGMRAFVLLRTVLRVCTLGRVRKLPPPLPWLERGFSRVSSPTGDQLVMLFTKPGNR